MQDRQGGQRSISGGTFAVVIAAFILALVVMTWAPWNPQRIASNPGPSGTPGSTVIEKTPPPAAGPSGTTTDGTTTGTAR